MGEIVIKVPGDVREEIELDEGMKTEEISKVRKRVDGILRKLERRAMLLKLMELEKNMKEAEDCRAELYEWLSDRY